MRRQFCRSFVGSWHRGYCIMFQAPELAPCLKLQSPVSNSQALIVTGHPSGSVRCDIAEYHNINHYYTVYRQVQEIKGCSVCKYSLNSKCHLSSRLLSVLAMLMPIVHLFLPRGTSEMFHHFVLPTKTTQPRLQVFSVNCSIIWQFCRTIDAIFHILQNSSKFG